MSTQTWTYGCAPMAARHATGKQFDGNAAARQLQAVINDWASRGWEYCGTEQFTVQNQPGCFSAFFGGKPLTMTQVVVIFRQPAGIEPATPAPPPAPPAASF
ncbi:MAG: hypothetical protein ACTHN0_08040 [Aquihabitans sp.]